MQNSKLLQVLGLARNPLMCLLQKSHFHCGDYRLATVFDLCTEWSVRFKEAGIPEPEESSGYIAAHLLGCKTFSLVPYKHLMRSASEEEKDLFRQMGHRRLQRMPIQYILGDWDFAGINLKMRPPVFIPRPETEVLVNMLMDEIRCRLDSDAKVKVLEIGCGTGAITLSLLSAYRNDSIQFVAIDAADHAINLTSENAQHLNLCNNSDKLTVMKHKVGVDDDETLMNLGPFDFVVSNPPYVPTSDMESLPSEISWYEDINALHGGFTGLDVVKTIIYASSNLLTENGAIWLEVDSSHPAMIKELYKDWTVDCFHDMYNERRFCRLAMT